MFRTHANLEFLFKDKNVESPLIKHSIRISHTVFEWRFTRYMIISLGILDFRMIIMRQERGF